MLEDVCMTLEYDEIVEKYKTNVLGEGVVYITRNTDCKRLLISVATLMNNGVFAGVTSYYRYFPGDVLCIVDPANSYYLRNDAGVRVKSVIAKVLERYAPEDVVFCGASMAGFASIDLALHFNANAVVNNPQVNLKISTETAWDGLRAYLNRIPAKYNIDDIQYTSRETVIGAVIGQHPMDTANRDVLFSICGKIQGVGLIFGNSFDTDHKYYYQGINGFLGMVDSVLNHRLLMSRIHAKYPKAPDPILN